VRVPAVGAVLNWLVVVIADVIAALVWINVFLDAARQSNFPDQTTHPRVADLETRADSGGHTGLIYPLGAVVPAGARAEGLRPALLPGAGHGRRSPTICGGTGGIGGGPGSGVGLGPGSGRDGG
jgi:hypothetical protein